MEFKFGHRVLVRDEGWVIWQKARFIDNYPSVNRPYCVLVEGCSESDIFTHCKLDPDATEFLPGDKVEVSDDKEEWFRASYHGFVKAFNDKHYVSLNDSFYIVEYRYCRYPQEPAKNDRIAELQVKVDGLYNEVSNQLGYFCQKFDKLQDELNRIK